MPVACCRCHVTYVFPPLGWRLESPRGNTCVCGFLQTVLVCLCVCVCDLHVLATLSRIGRSGKGGGERFGSTTQYFLSKDIACILDGPARNHSPGRLTDDSLPGSLISYTHNCSTASWLEENEAKGQHRLPDWRKMRSKVSTAYLIGGKWGQMSFLSQVTIYKSAN